MICLLGSLSRFQGLGEPSLWHDEIVHVEKAERARAESWGRWLTGLRVDPENGPLFYGLQNLTRGKFEVEFAARLIPAILGVVTIPILAVAALQVAGPAVGLTAATLLAVSPLHVCYSREGRPYAGVMLFSALFLWLLVRPRSRSGTLLAWLASIAAVYLGAATVPVLAAFSATLVLEIVLRRWQRTERPPLESFGLLLPPVVGLLLVWPLYLRHKTFPGIGGLQTDLLETTSPFSKAGLDRFLASLTVSGVEWATSSVFTFLLIALGALGFWTLYRKNRLDGVRVAVYCSALVGVTFGLLLIQNRWFAVRYTTPVLPAFLLLAAVGIAAIACRSAGALARLFGSEATGWSLLGVGLLTMGVAIPGWEASRTEPWEKPDWRGAVELIRSLAIPGEPVISVTWWPDRCLRFYSRLLAPEIPIPSLEDRPTSAPEIEQQYGTAWIVSAGYARPRPELEWIRSTDLVMHHAPNRLEVFFFPDFPTLLSTRRSHNRSGFLERRFEELQQRIEFDQDPLLLGEGWSFPEWDSLGTSYRWADSERAEIAVPVAAPRDGRIGFRSAPFPGLGKAPQVLRFSLNGSFLQQIEMRPGWSEYKFRIAADRWRSGPNLLVVDFGNLASPADQDSGAEDHRRLAAAFDFLEVSFD